jgi:hypothetical protein
MSSYALTALQRFLRSSLEIYTPKEVSDLSKRLEMNPSQGRIVSVNCPVIRSIRHPVVGRSTRGFNPVCIYIIDEYSQEVLLVDVYNSDGAWQDFLKDPANVATLTLQGIRIMEIIQRVLGDSN